MSYIRINRYAYEEPYHVNLVMQGSNGRQAFTFEYYCNASDLSDIGDALQKFPRHNSDVYLYEFGSERKEDKWSYYFRFRVFLIEASGATGIQLCFNNNAELPDIERGEFCIRCEPSQVNRLGKLFSDFSKLQHEELVWNVSEGHLNEKRGET